MKETYIKNYFATKDGLIYSNKTGVLKPMALYTRKDGYQTAKTGEQKLVHRLVASAYLGDIAGFTINHIDGNKSNNNVKNLEIVSVKVNVQHSWDTGLSKKGDLHGKCTHKKDKLISALSEIKGGASVNSTSKKFGISQSYLNKVKNGVYRSDVTGE